MGRIGRLIAAEMRDRARETDARVQERLAHRRACARLEAERAERFPTPTAETVREMLAWQERRLAELVAEES